MATIILTDAQRSALECSGVDLMEDAEVLVVASWAGRRLLVTTENAEAILRVLTDRANAEDYAAEQGDRGARGARAALTNLSTKVLAVWRDLQDAAASAQVNPNPAGVDYLPPDDPGDVGEDPNA